MVKHSWLSRSVVFGAGSALCGATLLAATAFAAAPAGKHSTSTKWLSYNASAKKATLKLVSEYNSSNNGYNFDGFSKGKMVVTIPEGWTVTVKCSTAASAAVNHSCGITKGLNGTKAAFSGSEVPSAQSGLAPGSAASFSFVPTKTGNFKIVCLVPGHIPAGMWDTLTVVASGMPSVTTK